MTEYIKNQLIKLCDNPEWFNDMLNTWDFKPERESQAIKEYLIPCTTKRKTRKYPYRTEELRPYLRYPNQEINKNHLHSEHIRLQIRDILQIPLIDITIIDIISLP